MIAKARFPRIEDPVAHELLLAATKSNDLALLASLLDSGLSPSAAVPDHPSLLEVALRTRTKEFALMLIERGADVSETPFGYSLFSLAFDHSDYRALCFALLEAGADVNWPGYNNGSAVANAVSRDDPQLCEALIAAGADVTKENVFGTSPLRQAIDNRKSNSFELMRMLVKAGASTSALPLSSNPFCPALTPFQYAVAHGFARHVAFMIDEFEDDPSQVTLRRATINVEDEQGRRSVEDRIVEAGTTMLDLTQHSAVRIVLYAAIAERSVDSAIRAAVPSSARAVEIAIRATDLGSDFAHARNASAGSHFGAL